VGRQHLCEGRPTAQTKWIYGGDGHSEWARWPDRIRQQYDAIRIPFSLTFLGTSWRSRAPVELTIASRRDDDVLRLDLGLPAVIQRDVDLGRGSKRRGALDVVDAVLLEQVGLDTTSKSLDGRGLGGEHLLQVELDVTDVDTPVFEVVLGLVVDVRVVEPGRGVGVSPSTIRKRRFEEKSSAANEEEAMGRNGGQTSDE
jgi:hypothetical protein